MHRRDIRNSSGSFAPPVSTYHALPPPTAVSAPRSTARAPPSPPPGPRMVGIALQTRPEGRIAVRSPPEAAIHAQTAPRPVPAPAPSPATAPARRRRENDSVTSASELMRGNLEWQCARSRPVRSRVSDLAGSGISLTDRAAPAEQVFRTSRVAAEIGDIPSRHELAARRATQAGRAEASRALAQARAADLAQAQAQAEAREKAHYAALSAHLEEYDAAHRRRYGVRRWMPGDPVEGGARSEWGR